MSLLSTAVGLAVGCSGSTSADDRTGPPPTLADTSTPTPTLSIVATGLSSPWDIAPTPDSALLFTEKCRGLSVRRANGSISRLFGAAGSAVVASDFFCDGQSGMNGIALDPDFATNRTLYLFMPSTLSGATRTNRVVRLVVDAGYTTVSARTDIITDMAYKQGANGAGGSGAHSGGRLRFGPDGFLWVSTGDNHDATLPQDPVRLGGKVLRVDRDGAAAPGNAAPVGFDRRIYTYGHRNVQGITFRPGSGQAFVAEHGPNHSDEVTPLLNGGNGGWDPQLRPGLTCPDGYCGYAGNPMTMPMTDLARFPSAMRPAWTNNGSSQGMGPAVFLSGASWKGWNGRLAIGMMGGQRVELLELDALGATVRTTNMGFPPTRFRSLVLGPDARLWVVTDAGEIWRVTP